MKLSHKIRKLGQPLTYRRTWRRMERALHPLRIEPLFAKIDRAKLAEIQAQYGFTPNFEKASLDSSASLRKK